ncbi:MAG: hypothetical protein M5U30_01945 [Burkholderiaceae bacterium]|nr:hypothetical protein [Burkholderiaceae bacterium]
MNAWLLLSLAAIFVAMLALLAALASAWSRPLPRPLAPAAALPPLWRPAPATGAPARPAGEKADERPAVRTPS